MDKNQSKTNISRIFALFCTLTLGVNLFFSSALAESPPILNWSPTSGLPVADEENGGEQDQSKPKIINSFGNSIVVWQDKVNGTDYDIYAEKFDPNGVAQWNPGTPGAGIVVASGAGDQPENGDFSIISDGSGGVIIVYAALNGSATDVYAERISSGGSPLWGNFQVTNTVTKSETVPQAYYANTSAVAYITFQISGATSKIGASRLQELPSLALDTTGNWGGSGTYIVADSGVDERTPRIISDNFNNPIITWLSVGAFSDLKAMSIDTGANIIWSGDLYNGATCAIVINYDITRDTNGGIYAGVLVYTGSSQYQIRMHRIDNSGATPWDVCGITIYNDPQTASEVKITTDNDTTDGGGAIIAWEDNRNGNIDIYAQHVGSDGIALWTTNGVAVSDITDTSNQTKPQIANNGGNGAIITFVDAATNSIFAQQFMGNGTRLWPTNFAVEENNGVNDNPTLSSDNNGGAQIAWEFEDGGVGTYDILGQYLTDDAATTCLNTTPQQICGIQLISDGTLTLTEVPDSFFFDPVTTTPANAFNNENTVTTPDTDDRITVLDTRETGGFELQINVDTDFEDANNPLLTIPIDNLRIVSSTTSPVETLPSTTIDNGIIFDNTISTYCASAPLDSAGGDLGLASTFPVINEFNINIPKVLMNCTLPANSGRNGSMSQYISYYLQVPGGQATGSYAAVVTYTLLDSTT